MGPFLGLTWLVGMFVSTCVLRARAGVGVWGRMRIFGSRGFGPTWFVTGVIASFAWPITLAIWLARGRPEPRVVFNEKALERERRNAQV
jgi:hypothetical protein